MCGFKSLTCLLFVALLSVTVQAEALIGHHPTLHRHMKRNELQDCTKDMASQAFKVGAFRSNTTAAICYKAGHDYKIEDTSVTHFRPGFDRSCYVRGWFGNLYTYE